MLLLGLRCCFRAGDGRWCWGRDLGCSGYESPAQLEADSALKARLESIRLQAELLARSRRQQAAQDSPLEQALLVTVAGIAPGNDQLHPAK